MSGAEFVDVRMRGFGPRADVAAVLALLDARTAPLPAEVVPLDRSAGRVLAEPVASAVDVPAFARAAMDGYAVRSADLAGASEAAPVPLEVVGEAFPARPHEHELHEYKAVRIATGAPVPAGADAILVAERARPGAERSVLALESVAPGKHVVRVGEDVAKGRVVLPAGRRLRPQDVGLLASIGAPAVNVVRKPRVAILVTGNELLPPGAAPSGYRIVDSNSPMLAALAERDGGEVLPVQRVRDDFATIRDAMRAAATSADVVLVSGGTSVGVEDHAPRAAAELGELAVHGVALRPAGPLGVAFVPGPLFLVPGNPVSCLCAYDLFAGRVVRRLGGRPWELPYRSRTLPLAAAIASAVGRADYVRVKLDGAAVAPLPTGGASNLSTAVAADGFVLVPPDRAALAVGEPVEVWLYD